MEHPSDLVPFGILGLLGGLWLLWRGFGGYRTAVTIGDTSTSSIATLAAGEVRITGVVEPAEVTLVSPLQSATCVWYRARVTTQGRDSREVFAEERAVGFRVRDAEGVIRVFPAGARIGVGNRFSGSTGLMGDAPVGLRLRSGSAYGSAVDPEEATPMEREAAIARLLTVQLPDRDDPLLADAAPGFGTALFATGAGVGSGGRDYEEARLEVGDTVTVVGSALPFGHLADPWDADRMDRTGDPLVGLYDPAVAAEIAEARANGTLLTPEEAWGNAAIPGFGIGRPVREPELDPAAHRPELATAEEAAKVQARFDIPPDTLVLAAAPDAPLLIVDGAPEVAVAREQGRFLIGLLGAVLAVGSAIALAIILGGLTR